MLKNDNMEISNITTVLKEIGLSEMETNVYLGLLKTGGADATTLAKKIDIKRTTVYPIIERLISQGLVTIYDSGRKKFFRAIKPSGLSTLYSRKIEALNSIIPKLEALEGKTGELYGVRFIRSKKEFELFYENVLHEYKGREYYIIGSASGFLNIDRDFLIEYRKRRAANNIKVKLIMSDDSRKEIGQNDPSLLRAFKYMPAKYFFRSTIDIYDDKIFIVGPELKAMAVVIEIPPMVDVFKSVFEILWETLEPAKQ